MRLKLFDAGSLFHETLAAGKLNLDIFSTHETPKILMFRYISKALKLTSLSWLGHSFQSVSSFLQLSGSWHRKSDKNWPRQTSWVENIHNMHACNERDDNAHVLSFPKTTTKTRTKGKKPHHSGGGCRV